MEEGESSITVRVESKDDPDEYSEFEWVVDVIEALNNGSLSSNQTNA